MNIELFLIPLVTMLLLFLAIFQSIGYRKKSKYMQERRKKQNQLREELEKLNFKIGEIGEGGQRKNMKYEMNSPFMRRLSDTSRKIKLMENEAERLRGIIEEKEKENKKPKKDLLRGNSFG